VALAGGTVPIDARLAEQAIDRHVAAPLGLSLRDAAWAVHLVASANMMRAVKAVSTYRGRDPRDCVLMAFGGNGGIFAVELARQLQMTRVLVPPAAGVFSALGLGVAPVEFSRSQAHLARIDAVKPKALLRAFAALEKTVVGALGYKRERLVLRRAAAMRYAGQAFELTVPLGQALDAASLAAAASAFEAEHERTYGHRIDNAPVELVAIEATATLIDDGRGATRLDMRSRRRARPGGTRMAYFGPETGVVETPVVDRGDLDDSPRAGPLIVEEYEGTSVVPPGASAALDAAGNIVIEVGP